jgi:hypothetical protein
VVHCKAHVGDPSLSHLSSSQSKYSTHWEKMLWFMYFIELKRYIDFISNQQYVDYVFGWFQYFQVCWDMTIVFMWFEIWVWKHDLRNVLMFYCLLRLRFKLWIVIWENDMLNCLCFMRKYVLKAWSWNVNVYNVWAWSMSIDVREMHKTL